LSSWTQKNFHLMFPHDHNSLTEESDQAGGCKYFKKSIKVRIFYQTAEEKAVP
jgi:hypothetical protein